MLMLNDDYNNDDDYMNNIEMMQSALLKLAFAMLEKLSARVTLKFASRQDI